jgi:branched-chain amino acid transport system ATP-binding protein
MLSVRALVVAYGAVRALKGVSLDVGKGEVVALIGANGAGKSSLLNAISGVVPVESGEILLDGQALHTLAGHRIVSQGVVQVPEGRQVFSDLTVQENLDMGGYSRKPAENREMNDRVLDLFPRLAERRQQLAGLMSGGEQQMLAIARGLMARPRVLLLDEPSMGLAPMVVADIFAVLKRLNAEGQTIMLVEQNARAALKLASRAYVLTNGEITLQGLASEMSNHPHVRNAFLGINKVE